MAINDNENTFDPAVSTTRADDDDFLCPIRFIEEVFIILAGIGKIVLRRGGARADK